MLSCLLPPELGDTEFLLLLSFRSFALPPPADPLSSKGLGPLEDPAFGECGVNKPGLGGGAGIGWGNEVGNPRTGEEGLSRWAVEGNGINGMSDGDVGDVGGGDVEIPGRMGNGASNVTFGTERDRGRGEAGGIAGGEGGSTEVSEKSGMFWRRR